MSKLRCIFNMRTSAEFNAVIPYFINRNDISVFIFKFSAYILPRDFFGGDFFFFFINCWFFFFFLPIFLFLFFHLQNFLFFFFAHPFFFPPKKNQAATALM